MKRTKKAVVHAVILQDNVVLGTCFYDTAPHIKFTSGLGKCQDWVPEKPRTRRRKKAGNK